MRLLCGFYVRGCGVVAPARWLEGPGRIGSAAPEELLEGPRGIGYALQRGGWRVPGGLDTVQGLTSLGHIRHHAC